MANTERPLKGGSYIRNKDGSLKRVGGTEETKREPAPAPTAPAEPAPEPTESDTSKKGK